MDGDGSLQVNHGRETLLQYRLIIKLKYTEANEAMLIGIAAHIGGKVRVVKEKVHTASDAQEEQSSQKPQKREVI